MKNYYIVSVDTVYLHTENIAIRETYQDALEVIKQHSDYTGKKGSGSITKINDKYERLFVWTFYDNVLTSKFDYVKNVRVSCCEDTEDEIIGIDIVNIIDNNSMDITYSYKNAHIVDVYPDLFYVVDNDTNNALSCFTYNKYKWSKSRTESKNMPVLDVIGAETVKLDLSKETYDNKTLTIDNCDKINLCQTGANIEVTIDKFQIENYDFVEINGRKFEVVK